MRQQPWLAATFAAIMLATAAYCLTRLALSWRRSRPTDRQVDAVHVLMGVAMAGMLVPRLQVVSPGGWEALFTAGAALFLWRTFRTVSAAGQQASPAHRPAHHLPHHLQHVLGCGAMVYMLAAMAGTGVDREAAAAAMSGAARPSAIALVLAVALFGCVVWNADRISALAPVAVLAGARTDGAVSSGAALARTTPISTGLPAAPPSPASPAAADIKARGNLPLSPRLAACCEIAMGVTTGYMLIAFL